MSVPFLTAEWFNEVDRLTAKAGDLNVPEQLAHLDLNLEVKTAEGPVEMCMTGGIFQKGFKDGAPIKMMLSDELAKKIFIEFDQSAAMAGFMAGQISVDGDMSQLMALQTVQPSDSQKELLNSILAMTV